MLETTWRLARVALLAAAVLGAILVWRLSRGPIPLDVLRGRVEAALSAEIHAAVSVGSLRVAWDATRRRVDLLAGEVRVGEPRDVPALAIPAVALRFRPHLGRPVFVLTAVELRGPRLRLVREPDGGIEVAVRRSGAADAPGVATRAGDVLASLRSDASRVRTVAVRRGQLQVLDRETGRVAELADLDLDLRRDGDRIGLRSAFVVALGETRVRVTGKGTARPDAEGSTVRIAFGDVVPAAVAERLPVGDVVARRLALVTMPVRGAVDVALDASLAPRRARLDLHGGPGSIAFSESSGAVPLRRARVDARVDFDADRLDVDTASADLGCATVHGRARIAGLRDDRAIDADALVARLPVDAVATCWPDGLAPRARRWALAHVSGGEVHDLYIHATGGGTDAGGFTLEDVTGSFAVRGVGVRWLGAMRPVTGVVGSASFTATAAQLDVSAASLGGLAVERGVARVNADHGEPRVAIEASVRGRLAEALTILQDEPASLGRRLPIAPDDVGGDVQARVALGFRLLEPPADLAASGLTVEAALSRVTVAHLVRGWSLSDGDLTVNVVGRQLSLAGDARLEGVPVRLAVRQVLGDVATRWIEVRGRVDGPARAALGIEPGRWLDGPVDVVAGMTPASPDGDVVDLDVDLRDASVELAPLAIAKPPGAPGEMHARLLARDGVLVAVERFEAAAAGSSLRARAARGPGDAGWRTVDADARIGPGPGRQKGARLTLAMRPAATASHIHLESDDAGTLVRSVGKGDAAGGRLVVDGTIVPEDPALPADATVDVRGFTLTRAPWLVRVATLASLGGILSGFSGGGIAFDRATAHVSHRQGKVTITDGTAQGSSLTLALDGTIDRVAETLDLRGTLVPSYYGLNQAPGRIPFIGPLLVGPGDAVQAFDFQVRGPVGDPDVTVQPLESIAPGALRDLLRLPSRPAPPGRAAGDDRSPGAHP